MEFGSNKKKHGTPSLNAAYINIKKMPNINEMKCRKMGSKERSKKKERNTTRNPKVKRKQAPGTKRYTHYNSHQNGEKTTLLPGK